MDFDPNLPPFPFVSGLPAAPAPPLPASDGASLQEAVVNRLLADAGVKALCGARVYGSDRPRDDPATGEPVGFPYAVCVLLNETPDDETFETDDDPWRDADVQISCFGNTSDAAEALARAAHQCLRPRRERLPLEWGAGREKTAQRLGGPLLTDPDADDQGRPVYHKVLGYRFTIEGDT